MAFVNPDLSFLDQANRVQKLHESVWDLREGLGKGALDARNVNLNNICMATNAAMGTLRLWQAAVADDGKNLAAGFGCDQPHLKMIREDMLRAAKLFLLLEFQFQTETLYASVTKAVGAAPAKMGFYHVAKATLAGVGIADADAKLRILTVPAKMRNSMHSNGVHHGRNETETINKVEFRFEDGKKVECGSWYHIVTALQASLETTAEVLKSPKVTNITLIEDSYAVQKAVDPGA